MLSVNSRLILSCIIWCFLSFENFEYLLLLALESIYRYHCKQRQKLYNKSFSVRITVWSAKIFAGVCPEIVIGFDKYNRDSHWSIKFWYHRRASNHESAYFNRSFDVHCDINWDYEQRWFSAKIFSRHDTIWMSFVISLQLFAMSSNLCCPLRTNAERRVDVVIDSPKLVQALIIPEW